MGANQRKYMTKKKKTKPVFKHLKIFSSETGKINFTNSLFLKIQYLSNWRKINSSVHEY